MMLIGDAIFITSISSDFIQKSINSRNSSLRDLSLRFSL
jgi:hypothetical protein